MGHAAAAVLISLVLAACSSGGSDESGDASDGGATPDGAASSAESCAATDDRLPEASDRDVVALLPIPDGLTDDGATFDDAMAVSGFTNTDVDPESAVVCVDQLIDELGWEVVHRSDDGSVNTANGHAVVATHPDLPERCLNASLFASAHTPVVAGDAGSRMEVSLRQLPDGAVCQF